MEIAPAVCTCLLWRRNLAEQIGDWWLCVCSWVVGLAPEAGRFFFYWLVTFLFHTFAVSIFRCGSLQLS